MSGSLIEGIIEQLKSSTKTTTELKQPKKYKVILLNDDYTPMDFVVMILKNYFHLSEELATQVMLQVHILGRGVCGIFTKDIAETKAALVNDYARSKEYPLLCTIEAD